MNCTFTVGGVSQAFRQLMRDCRGATLVEFAIVGPAFIALLIAIMVIGLTFLAQQGLETAAEASARLIMTGQSASMTTNQFQTAACNTLPPFLSCSRLYVNVYTVTSFSSASLAKPTITYDSKGNVTNSSSYSPGGSGSINVLQLYYLWPTVTGPLGFSVATNSGNNYLLVATSVFKSEAY